MIPQVIKARPDHEENLLSTADLAGVIGTPGRSSPTMGQTAQEPNLPLFTQNDTQDLRSRWEKIQIGFVDEPRTAVVQADELVATAIKRLAEIFAAERHALETEWDKTDNVSTEDLRVGLPPPSVPVLL